MKLFICIAFFLTTVDSLASIPAFNSPFPIKYMDAWEKFIPGGTPDPCVYDWNRDGRKDLIIGQNKTNGSQGSVLLYPNSKTNSDPHFRKVCSYIKAGGSNIAFPSG